MTGKSKFERAIELIDEANAADPNRELAESVEQAKELIYGRRMSAWLDRIHPGASEALRLAVRAQHLRRWAIPRNEFPMTRAGYHAWRTRLYRFHADEAGALLVKAGYDTGTIARVQELLQKKDLRINAETQALEDAACLVFIEYHLGEFARRDDMDEEKLIGVIRKTWTKMSEAAHQAALSLPIPDDLRAVVSKALAGN